MSIGIKYIAESLLKTLLHSENNRTSPEPLETFVQELEGILALVSWPISRGFESHNNAHP